MRESKRELVLLYFTVVMCVIQLTTSRSYLMQRQLSISVVLTKRSGLSQLFEVEHTCGILMLKGVTQDLPFMLNMTVQFASIFVRRKDLHIPFA